MQILAFDLATNIGWAAGSVGGSNVGFGSHRLPKTGDNIGEYLNAARQFMSDRIMISSPDLVVFEQPVLPKQTSITTCRKLYGLSGLIELICLDAGIGVKEVRIAKWRKHFIGRSQAPVDIRGPARRKWAKETVITRCHQLGFFVKSEDEGDAVGIWWYAAHPEEATPADTFV